MTIVAIGSAVGADGSVGAAGEGTAPAQFAAAIKMAMKADGTWLIADINGQPTFEDNLEKNPLARMMYAMSIMSCMSSAMSEPGGAGLGTLGLPEPARATRRHRSAPSHR